MSGSTDKLLAAAERAGRNPVPLALLGLGAAWVVFDQIQRNSSGVKPAGYFDIYEGYDPNEDAQGRLATRLATAKAKIAGAVDQARAGASSLARSVRAAGFRTSVRRRLGAPVEAEALAAGLVGFAIGLAIGFGLGARSRAED
ncbi:MAG: hypothetical protein GC203_13585 [Phenylobacterium sp.]|uniref:hypothetical protein n=1 Tax=Phenylobacterium sp. TaxID=1871053 RepID=UPI0025ECCF61|nr:hypothetical protein [Phenylobacterium sp.]MBI1198888.1 hypothetical protein [Phenylobacterium sp.]